LEVTASQQKESRNDEFAVVTRSIEPLLSTHMFVGSVLCNTVAIIVIPTMQKESTHSEEGQVCRPGTYPRTVDAQIVKALEAAGGFDAPTGRQANASRDTVFKRWQLSPA
jgi:hypothetical protein